MDKQKKRNQGKIAPSIAPSIDLKAKDLIGHL